MSSRKVVAGLAVLVAVGAASVRAQPPQGTAFTYQGRLTTSGAPATGSYDLQFLLYDASSGGAQVGPLLQRINVAVASGLFTVSLDFGAGAFAGSARWLEIGVRPGGTSGAFTTLAPRQELTPAPGAVFSASTPWSGISGKPAGFA